MSEIVATTAERLREAIEYRHTTAAEVSKATNISRGSLSQYMSGKFTPKQDRIYILAKHLRVSPAWLMGIDVPMESDSKPPSIPVHKDFMNYNDSRLQELTDMLTSGQGELFIVTPAEKTMICEFRKLEFDKKQLLFNMMGTMLQQQNAPTTTGNSDEGES